MKEQVRIHRANGSARKLVEEFSGTRAEAVEYLLRNNASKTSSFHTHEHTPDGWVSVESWFVTTADAEPIKPEQDIPAEYHTDDATNVRGFFEAPWFDHFVVGYMMGAYNQPNNNRHKTRHCLSLFLDMDDTTYDFRTIIRRFERNRIRLFTVRMVAQWDLIGTTTIKGKSIESFVSNSLKGYMSASRLYSLNLSIGDYLDEIIATQCPTKAAAVCVLCEKIYTEWQNDEKVIASLRRAQAMGSMQLNLFAPPL